MVFSIIIPHRNSVNTLPRLFNSIPDRDDLEIIVVDNSPVPLKREQITTTRTFNLYYSEPNRGAGGARNVGIEQAKGKWFIFADVVG